MKPLLEMTVFMNHIVNWLVDPGSFMDRLKRFGISHPKVRVVKHQFAFPTQEECQQLGIKNRQYALIREVLIEGNGKIVMFARTIFPLKSLQGKGRQFLTLKSRSLGSVLFKNPLMKRSEFEFSYFQANSIWHEKIEKYHPLQQEPIWLRESLFSIKDRKILLKELFLPDIERLFWNKQEC